MKQESKQEIIQRSLERRDRHLLEQIDHMHELIAEFEGFKDYYSANYYAGYKESLENQRIYIGSLLKVITE